MEFIFGVLIELVSIDVNGLFDVLQIELDIIELKFENVVVGLAIDIVEELQCIKSLIIKYDKLLIILFGQLPLHSLHCPIF